MLEEIRIVGEATYPDTGEILAGLKNINFIFGTNGSGKTTISRVIADPAAHQTSALIWKNGRAIETLVYNIDFINTTFAPEMPGIFTLGKATNEALADIKGKREKIAQLNDEIDNLNRTLGHADESSGKRLELRELRAAFEIKCWEIKERHDEHFKDAFAGLRSSKSKFCDRVIEEFTGNKSNLVELEELKRKALTVFDQDLERMSKLATVDGQDLTAVEESAVLSKKVVGKEDIDISALIRRLQNSDWVRQGLSYLNETDDQCPFCQQTIASELRTKLNSYFDDAYMRDIDAISTLLTSYTTHSTQLLETLESIAVSNNRYIAAESFRADLDRLASRIAINTQILVRKQKEPSNPVTLESTETLVSVLKGKLDWANLQIQSHNLLVENIATEQSTLKSEIWKCLVEESRSAIEAYTTAKLNLDNAVNAITVRIAAKSNELGTLQSALRDLERKITSVQPTVDAINGTLTAFGFKSFRLKTSGEGSSRYQIVRGDGRDAARTLSEGEKSFITFLYFYHLIRGSLSETGGTVDRIIVFDDPVSSLDSDVLFVVSTLIKKLLAEACSGAGSIKQVFVLTHNIYFHKEVSFDPKRADVCRTHETFWIIRKVGEHSKITGYDHNPIKTSYELLWGEVKNKQRSNSTIRNTLRRIVESYFKILGNVDTDDIVAKFEGEDQQICASLFSWVHDGSHWVHDDIYVASDHEVVERYLKVFKEIFVRTKQDGHYRMMMGADPA